MDLRGELPVHIEGCYMVTQPRKLREGIEELKRFNREFDTDHLRVHTLKLIMDGTLKNETAAMVTPYADTGATGTCAFTADEIAQMLRDLNEAGMDVHVHTIGKRSSRVVLDGVEQARRELGDDFRVRVTCAHLELQDDADLGRFAELGVICNYTLWWHGGMGETDQAHYFGEERAKKMYRCKTVWDTGALVTWSSDNIAYGDFTNWSPYLGMEVGMTRWVSEQTVAPEYTRSDEEFPSASEKMGVEEMILGYTINGAIELGIDDAKGSITVGKDVDFLVFECDLTRAEHVGFSQNVPDAVYFAGRLVGGEGSLAGLEEARRSAEQPWRSHWGACGSAGRDPRHGA